MNTTQDVYDYLINGHYALQPDLINELLELYPDNPALGSPFNEPNTVTWPGFGDQFKRIASLLGDYLLAAPVRFSAETNVAQGRSTFKYRFNSTLPGAAPEKGVYHASEFPFVNSLPTPDFSKEQNATSQHMTRSWVSFIHSLDPNYPGSPLTWPEYKDGKMNMVFSDVPDLEVDDWRAEGIYAINSHLLQFLS